MRSIILCGAVLVGALGFAPVVALADDQQQTAAQIDAAVAAQGAAPVASNSAVSVPATGSAPVTAGEPGSAALAVGMPASGAAAQIGPTTIFDSTAEASSVAVQPTDGGLRVLVHLDAASAPERYPFTLGGDVVRMQQDLDGAISAYAVDGRRVTHIAAPWARDASGRDVPAFYEIDGNTLVLVVKHQGGDWTYGITADPLFDDIIDAVVSAGKSVFETAKKLAKKYAVPVCAAKAIVDAYNKLKDARLPPPGPELEKFVRRVLSRELVGCVPEAGQYAQILYDWVLGEEP
jgi:hypothetical protein